MFLDQHRIPPSTIEQVLKVGRVLILMTCLTEAHVLLIFGALPTGPTSGHATWFPIDCIILRAIHIITVCRWSCRAGNPSATYLRGWWASGGSGYAWQKIWTDGNDGSGSGLDADLLDGQQGSYYAPNTSLGNYVLKGGHTSLGAAYKTTFYSGSGGVTFGANHYSMGVDVANNAWSSPNYSDLIIGYHTGIRIGAAYGGTKFYNNSPTTDTNNNGEGDGAEVLLMTVGGVNGGSGVSVSNHLTAADLRLFAVGGSVWLAGTDGNWRLGRDIKADSGGMITGAAIQLLTGGDGTTYGFQILGHQSNTSPCFEVAPGANPSLSATRIVGRLQVGEDLVTGDGITIHSYYGNGGGSLRFDSGHGSNSHVWEMGNITVTDDGNYNGRIEFRTSVSGRQTPTTKMTIKADGAVNIPGTVTVGNLYTASTYANSWFRNTSANAGLYSQSHGAHWYANGAGTWNMGGGGGSAYLRMRTTHQSTIIGTMHANTSYQHGFLNTSDGWKFFADNSNNFYCYGNITAYYSDGRLKDEQIQLKTGSGLDLINKLKVKSFVWNALTEDNPAIKTGTTEIGLIAQEVEPLIPSAVVINEASNPSSAQIEHAEKEGLPIPDMPDYKTINYDKLIPFLIQAVQKLQTIKNIF